jgi:hypothetical protein
VLHTTINGALLYVPHQASRLEGPPFLRVLQSLHVLPSMPAQHIQTAAYLASCTPRAKAHVMSIVMMSITTVSRHHTLPCARSKHVMEHAQPAGGEKL